MLMFSWDCESLRRDCCRKCWIMFWLFMGLVFGCVVEDRVSGEYDVQCLGLLKRGLCDLYGE